MGNTFSVTGLAAWRKGGGGGYGGCRSMQMGGRVEKSMGRERYRLDNTYMHRDRNRERKGGGGEREKREERDSWREREREKEGLAIL